MLSNYEVAQEVISGKWGNGTARRTALEKAGYNYAAVQSIVNSLVYDTPYTSESEIVQPVQKQPLEVNYYPDRYDGIIVNVIIGGNNENDNC